MEKLIITVAPVGAEVTREQNVNLPLTPVEIAEDVHKAWKAGASIAHVHARDAQGAATQDIEVYRAILEEIKKRCDIIVQVSTGGAVGMKPDVRVAPVRLKPEMATLSTGTCNFGNDVFMNTQADMEFFAAEMKTHGVLPELEVFDWGFMANALQLIKKEIVPAKVNFDFVLGVPGALPGTAKALTILSGEVPKNCTWTVAGIGRFELPLAMMAISMGGNVRVGFEDNTYYLKGVPADSNAQLVERIARISRETGREVATPDEARKILGLK